MLALTRVKMKPEHVKRALLEAYEDRLRKSLAETDVVDKEGNILLTKDLKARDKASGYEYTVDTVKKVDGDVMIVLRAPDAPRFTPPPSGPDVISSSDPELDVYIPGGDSSKQPASMVVTQQDFEKNFEVE